MAGVKMILDSLVQKFSKQKVAIAFSYLWDGWNNEWLQTSGLEVLLVSVRHTRLQAAFGPYVGKKLLWIEYVISGPEEEGDFFHRRDLVAVAKGHSVILQAQFHLAQMSQGLGDSLYAESQKYGSVVHKNQTPLVLADQMLRLNPQEILALEGDAIPLRIPEKDCREIFFWLKKEVKYIR